MLNRKATVAQYQQDQGQVNQTAHSLPGQPSIVGPMASVLMDLLDATTEPQVTKPLPPWRTNRVGVSTGAPDGAGPQQDKLTVI
jgi:hypothetical protein